MLNDDALDLLDEAMFTSSLISNKERKNGRVNDWESVFPASREETERMEQLLDKAEEVVEDPTEQAYAERLSDLRDVVDWSKKRHRSWTWKLIAGALVGAGIFYYFENDQKDDIERAKADLAAVQASYKKNVRNKLRKITPLLKIHVLKEKSELGEWIRPLNDSNRKNGVEGWGRGVDYYEDIWDAFGDQVSFMEVRTKEGDELVSSRMVFNFDDETETFSSGTIQALRQFNGMTFMQDWQIDQCLKAGQKRINFYGIAGDFSKDNHLLEFKSGFGVIVEEYIGGFEIVLNPLKHNAERAAHLVRRAGGIAKHGIGKIVKRAKTRQTKVVHKVSTE